MTPRQARVALGGFFLLAIGVTSNALYLQGAVSGAGEKTAAAVRPARPPAAPKGPAATTGGKAADKMPDRQAAKAADKPATPAPSVPEPESGGKASKNPPPVKIRMVRVTSSGEARAEEDASTVRAVQEALNQQGYGPIEADGVMRQPTRAAIMAFEHDQGQGLSGEASQALLKQLVFGIPGASLPSAGGEDEVLSPHAEAIVEQVQQALIERGYRPGDADGLISAETIAALRTFETDQGLVPKGRISAEVLERLSTGISAGGKHPVEGP